MDASVFPVIEPADSSDTRWALETARTLWSQGERREALQWVRRAAEAASEAGADDRALDLAKSGAELRAALDIPLSVPPPPIEEAPAIPAMPPSAPVSSIPFTRLAQPMAAPASKPPSIIPMPAQLGRRVDPRAPASGAPPVPGSSPASSVVPVSAAAPASSAGPASEPRGDGDLVVTIVSGDGGSPGPSASLVSHRAVRVAVLAVAPGARELKVRRLADGEVAPKDATVALLVAFEPGTSPVP